MAFTNSDTISAVPFEGVVNCIECCPFNFCDSLIAVASYVYSSGGQASHQLTIAKFHPKAKDDAMIEILKECYQDKLTTSIAWSPKTFIDSLPYNVQLCTGSIDGKISMVSSDLRDVNEMVVLGSHSKAVNAVALDWDQGTLLASTGDDHKCILWDVEGGKKFSEFCLKSAGVDVKFHRYDSTKLLVAEKTGLIRFYDVTTLSAYMSVVSTESPLKSVCWSDDDFTRIHAVAAACWLTFDTSKKHEPVSKVKLSSYDEILSCATQISQCPSSSHIVAVSSGRSNNIRIYSTTRGDKVLSEMNRKVGDGFSWHQSTSNLLAGGDSRILILKCDSLL